MAAEEKKEKEKDAKAEKTVEKTAEATPESEAKAAKKKRLIIFIAAGVLVVGGGAGAAMFLLGGSGEGHKTTEHAEGEGHEGEKAKEGHGEKAEEHGKAAEHGEAKGGHDAKKSEEKKEEGGQGKKEEGGHEKKEEGGHGKKEEAKGDKAAANDGVDFGQTFVMKPFHLNLGNPLENRYVRLELSLEYKGGEQQKGEIEKRMPQLRDAVGNIASRKSREFLLGPDGKDQLRHEILVRINQFMGHPIESVFITDMLIE